MPPQNNMLRIPHQIRLPKDTTLTRLQGKLKAAEARVAGGNATNIDFDEKYVLAVQYATAKRFTALTERRI